MSPVRLGIVGAGWRTDFYLRAVHAFSNRFAVTQVVARSAESRTRVASDWSVPTTPDLSDLIATRPDFVLVAVPWEAAPVITEQLVDRGIAVLQETPAAPDVAGMRAAWARVGGSGLVQIADQAMFMPGNVARKRIIDADVIGTPVHVQVCSNHLYHAVAIMRGLLGTRFDPVTVSARSLVAPLVDPLTFDGHRGNLDTHNLPTTLATLDFGAGRSGFYDFTENQWFNPLRQRRLLIRGTHGEIADDRVVRMGDPWTVLESTIQRRATGRDLSLEGFDLDNIAFEGQAVFVNEFKGGRLSDEEIAAAAMMRDTGRWVRGEGPAPYPLAEGCQDHLVGLAIQESAASGRDVTTARELWAG